MMKKTLLSVLFVLLLIQGNTFAEILDLGNGLKINLPNNFSYYQQTLEQSNKDNGLQQTKEEIEANQKTMEEIGFYLNTKITSMALGMDWIIPEFETIRKTGTYSDKAMKEIIPVVKKCQRKKTDEAYMNCFGKKMFKHFKLLPWFAIMGATDVSDELSIFDEITSIELTKSEKKGRDKYLKEIENDHDAWINQTDGIMKAKMKPKIIIDDQGLWQIRYKGHINMMGAVFKSNFYIMIVNNRIVQLLTICDGKSCKSIDQKVAKILAPSFKINSKKQSFNLNDKEDMMKMVGTIRTGYRYYKVAKFLILLL
jgi:hypothetical protein